MNDLCIYIIELRGPVNEAELNLMSPLQMTVERNGPAATVFSVCSDQSGLVGLMRHLHGLGLVFLSVSRLDREGGPDAPNP